MTSDGMAAQSNPSWWNSGIESILSEDTMLSYMNVIVREHNRQRGTMIMNPDYDKPDHLKRYIFSLHEGINL